MTQNQKDQIEAMRLRGMPFREIAGYMGLKTDTVRKHCSRNKVAETVVEEDGLHCRHCGKVLP